MTHEIQIDQCLTTLRSSRTEAAKFLPARGKPPSAETLEAWFESLAGLQNTTGSHCDLFAHAAAAVRCPGGLDGGIVLMIDPDTRRISNWYGEHSQQLNDVPIRYDLLHRSAADNLTIYHAADQLIESQVGENTGMQSLDHPAFIVTPLLDEHGVATGFLVGWRRQSSANHRKAIRDLEAHFVQLVGKTLSSILVRLERERELAESTSLLAQVFPQKVVRHLAVDPTILEGRETPVSVLFADLRGFSAISNRLPTRQTYELINAIMDSWTDEVRKAHGMVVDYFGDGLVAFWNAPLETECHAQLAVQCAGNMIERLQKLSVEWYSVVGEPLDAGFGIASGMAHVGNCGSKQRIKYGPHGSVVNLAARLEKLTKSFSVPIVVSEETSIHVQPEIPVRRLCRARLSGFEPVNVFQAYSSQQKFSSSQAACYETLLKRFEIEGPSIELHQDIGKALDRFAHDPALHSLHHWSLMEISKRERGAESMSEQSSPKPAIFLRADEAVRT